MATAIIDYKRKLGKNMGEINLKARNMSGSGRKCKKYVRFPKLLNPFHNFHPGIMPKSRANLFLPPVRLLCLHPKVTDPKVFC
jgi:hypothetical protein